MHQRQPINQTKSRYSVSIDTQRRWTFRQAIKVLLSDFIMASCWHVLFVLVGSLMETHNWASHPLLRIFTGFGRVIETFADLVAAKVRQWILLWLLAQVFALDQRVVDFGLAGARLRQGSQGPQVFVAHCRCGLRLDNSFVCVKRAFVRL